MRVGFFLVAAACSFHHGNAQLTPVDATSDTAVDASTATRVLLTIHNSLRGESFDDFAAQVAVDPTRIEYAFTAAGGADVRFFASDDATPLPYELDTWNPTGRSAFWVRVPTIPAFTDMNIWMHYGDPTATSQSNPHAAWSAEHVVVWHFNEDPSTGVHDSTANAHDGTASTGIDASRLVTGPIGKGLQFQSSATECVLAAPSPQFTLPTYTWQMWMNGDDAPTTIGSGNNLEPISNGDVGFNFAWDHHLTAFTAAAAQHSTASAAWGSQTVGAATVSMQTWYLVTATYDGTQLCAYLDGAARGCSPIGTPDPPNGSLSVGGPNAGTGCLPGTFGGRIDEMRVESVARTPARIDAEFQSQADDPASPFVTFGMPQRLP